MTDFHRTLALAAISLLLAACGSAPVAPTASAGRAMPVVLAPTPAPPTLVAPASSLTAVNLPQHLDPRSKLSAARSVYFEFDDAALKPEFALLVEMHGKYLAENPSVGVTVEGNADDRGSAEYNLALGQKRAQAVLRALEVHGVRNSQVEAVSWGEEKPKAAGQGESARAKNRRADLRYPAK